MAIEISRESGAVSAPDYTQDQIDLAWEQVVRAWGEANRAQLHAMAEEYATEPHGK